MYKVGILTLYYENTNYGALLQAYALQKTIENLGYPAEQISYALNSGYPNERLKEQLKPLIDIYRHLKRREWHKCRDPYEKNIYKFADEIPHSKKVTAKNISSLNKKYDTFVCGSDQVWNPIGWQPTLFLDFVSKGKKKIAYAASVARDYLSDSEIEFVLKYTKDYNALSVREDKSADILNTYQNKKYFEVMPDPTMLLTKDEWKKTAASKLIKEPYIFAYFLGENVTQREQAIQYAEKNRMKIVFIPYMQRGKFQWDKEHIQHMYKNAGVPEFLSLIQNAELVLTDSYHGCVFSIIFNKKFYVMKRFADNDVNSMNSRIVTLLEAVGLKKRYVEIIPELDDNTITQDELIMVNARLDMLRRKGIKFLKKALEE